MRNNNAGGAIDVNAKVVAVGHDVVGGQARGVLCNAFLVAAKLCARGAATKRDAHAHAGLRYVLRGANDQVALYAPAAAGAFHEDAIRDAVAAVFDKVADQVVQHLPAVGAHQVKGGGGALGGAGQGVGDGVVLQQAMVWPVATQAVDFEVGIEVFQFVVAQHQVGAVAKDVKGVFARALVFTHTANIQVFKHPVGLVHLKTYLTPKFNLYLPGLVGAQGNALLGVAASFGL